MGRWSCSSPREEKTVRVPQPLNGPSAPRTDHTAQPRSHARATFLSPPPPSVTAAPHGHTTARRAPRPRLSPPSAAPAGGCQAVRWLAGRACAACAMAGLQPVLRMGAADGQLTANGQPFRLKGVAWWGAESARALVGGLERRSLDEVLSLLARYGFNAIKITFLHQHVLFDDDVPAASFSPTLNPQLLDSTGRPLKYVAALRAIARRAAGHGLLVWLVPHSLEGLWYSRAISEATVLDSWTALSRQLCTT